jgi:glycosyltransferase involved in cell wall biosynthesis
MRVLIIGELFSFPNGTGATTRVRAFAAGLREAGAQVYVMMTRPIPRTRTSPGAAEAVGVYEGTPYMFAGGSTARLDAALERRLSPLLSLATASRVISDRTSPAFDAVIFVTGHTTLLPLVVGSAARLRGAVLLFDGCELPFVYERHLPRRRFQERFYTPVAYRWFDGVIVISEYLERYFESRIRRSSRLLHVPILVDVDRFANAEDRSAFVADATDGRPFIAYTGEINPAKGTDALVRSFATIASSFPDVDLVLTGYGNPPDYLRYTLALAEELGVGGRLRYLGVVDNDELPSLLRSASVLALPHPAGEFSQAAFPTKLGEYLASGTPVVATRVGEVDRYISDGESAYLVPPGDPAIFAERLAQALSRPDESRTVGLRGQEVARRSFDIRPHGRRMLDFIADLKDERRRVCP